MHERLSQWWNRVSLRTKITGVTVLLVTLGLLVAGVGTMTVLRNYLMSEADRKVATFALDLSSIAIGVDATCERTTGPASYFVAMLDADGDIICNNRANNQAQPNVSVLTESIVGEQKGSPITLWDTAHTQQWRVVAVPYVAPNGSTVTLAVGLNLADTNGIIAQYAAVFLGFGLSVIVLGAALTRLLVTSTFAPLREVEATAAAIAEGDFSQRLPGATPNTEVGRLNRSLNTMLNRIDRAFADRARTIDQMRRFVGDASHELRTPLVSVRGYAELYRMGALGTPQDVAQAMERIEKEAIRMGELVEDLLELARIDEARPLQLAPVDLVPLANDAALDAMAFDPTRTVSVIVQSPAPVESSSLQELVAATSARGPKRVSSNPTGPIAFAGATLAKLRSRRKGGAPQVEQRIPVASLRQATEGARPAVVNAAENKIRQVITNLMGNAMRFTPAGSPIELVVGVDEDRSMGTLAIVDHGEGIAPQIREKIFQRFWRADTSRARETGGTGLGLAIVAGIVAAHKGTVEVLDTPGGGATFRVSLPLLPTLQAPEPAAD